METKPMFKPLAYISTKEYHTFKNSMARVIGGRRNDIDVLPWPAAAADRNDSITPHGDGYYGIIRQTYDTIHDDVYKVLQERYDADPKVSLIEYRKGYISVKSMGLTFIVDSSRSVCNAISVCVDSLGDLALADGALLLIYAHIDLIGFDAMFQRFVDLNAVI